MLPHIDVTQQGGKLYLDTIVLVVDRVVGIYGHVLMRQALLPVVPHQTIQEADLITGARLSGVLPEAGCKSVDLAA